MNGSQQEKNANSELTTRLVDLQNQFEMTNHELATSMTQINKLSGRYLSKFLKINFSFLETPILKRNWLKSKKS